MQKQKNKKKKHKNKQTIKKLKEKKIAQQVNRQTNTVNHSRVDAKKKS